MLRMLIALGVGMLIPAITMAVPDDYPIDPGKWLTLNPPAKHSSDWLVANNDVKHEWFVTLRDGRPEIRLLNRADKPPAPLPFDILPGTAREGLSGDRLAIKVSDGWIVAFNAGEFGAGLWWFSPDGRERSKIATAWITSFIETDSELLALEGIAHMSTNRGRMLRLARGQGGGWKSEDLIDLKHTPRVVAKGPDGSLIVATTNRLLMVFPADNKTEVLLDDTFWEGLYPNSLVVTPGGTIYLGMRHGVAKVEKKGGTYKIFWLLPNRQFADMKLQEGFK